MTTEERLDRLTIIVDSLAASVVHHDDQIEKLIATADKHSAQIAMLAQGLEETRRLTEEVAQMAKNLEKQWQAYINTLPRQ